MIIVSQHKDLVLESFPYGFFLLESDYITDFHKTLCDQEGNLYNVLDYIRVEDEDISVLTKQITMHRKVYFSCVRLDKPIRLGSTLSPVYKSYC